MTEKHFICEYDKDHKGKDYGCIKRHDSGGVKTPCDHKYNAYLHSKTLDDMFKKDHLANAKKLGYIDIAGLLTNKAELAIQVDANEKEKDAKWAKKYFKKYKTSMYWLQRDDKAWTVGYKSTKVKPNNSADHTSFLTKAYKGCGSWFPYWHNAHHIIPQSAIQNYLVSGEGEIEPRKRAELIIASKWNLNNEKNMVILPQELQVSEVADLVAHCPYGTCDHRDYTLSLEDDLTALRQKVDAHLDKTKDCEKVEPMSSLKDDIGEISGDFLDEIKKIKPGKQVGT